MQVMMEGMGTLDQAEARRIRAEVLDSGQELSARWLSSYGNCVVPAEDVSDLTDDPLGARIIDAFAEWPRRGVLLDDH
ncbi:hypothetical protein NCAST_20_00420 [Nocardia asteroides NBRC 15531]|uniref:Uncharacterized protein n=1 Tax=Nocardia asteroides NBRC 15531 TaxID=1110697 RepID=U5E412_NOCAS|nr:hypothetical protein NCAST_20_00420 [Nocardia asteroides NBRC 15531]SFL75050.1 hypothetical protein SAMN05444423_101776 [Nocardia asteroides]VEG31300.1 Uncharacterised protein [Nocardia asteroides]